MPQDPKEKEFSQIPPLAPEEKKKFSELVKFLSRSFVQTQTFGIEHPLAKQPIEQCFTLLNNLIQEKGNVALYIAENKLKYGQSVLEEKNPVVSRMIALFSTVQLVSFEFEKDFNREDFLKLVSIFAAKPEDIVARGGVEKLVKDKNVQHLKLNPIKYELIGMHEKVVAEDAKIADEALDELEKQLAEKEAKLKTKEETSKDELLSLIDNSLKEGAEQTLFVDKLTENPLEVVDLITDAIRMVNKVGGENAKGVFSSIVNKLALVGDDLYRCLTEGKDEDENVKETYKAAGILGKELTERIKNIQVSSDLEEMVTEMTNVLTVLLDQIEAQKIISPFFKGEVTLNKQTQLLKKIDQREKSSPEFALLMKKLLLLKGLSEEEVNKLIDRKEELLQEAKREKEDTLEQDLTFTLKKLKDGQISVDEALAKLKEALKKRKR